MAARVMQLTVRAGGFGKKTAKKKLPAKPTPLKKSKEKDSDAYILSARRKGDPEWAGFSRVRVEQGGDPEQALRQRRKVVLDGLVKAYPPLAAKRAELTELGVVPESAVEADPLAEHTVVDIDAEPTEDVPATLYLLDAVSASSYNPIIQSGRSWGGKSKEEEEEGAAA